MLIAVLHDLFINDAIPHVTKREAIGQITSKRWFALKDEDRDPYPSQQFSTKEPRWHTLIAWSRKDSVLRDLVSYEARDTWGLTRRGRDSFERFYSASRDGKRPLNECFLWSMEFKRHLLPSYEAGSNDMERPVSFYRDTFQAFTDFTGF